MNKKRDWKSKVVPEFIRAAKVYREAAQRLTALGPNPRPEAVREVTAWVERETAEMLREFPEPPEPTDNPTLASPYGTQDEGFVQYWHWARTKEPLWLTTQKADNGDIDAQKALNRTVLDYQHTRRGDKLVPPKGNYDHSGLLWMGWFCGLSELTSEELGDCLDEVCPCGAVHDGDMVKKLRARFAKAIRKAEEAKKST